ncbi:glutaredoxin family protein [Quadrisphaera sp. DSM 44207]|uniref:glutaredoxin family protein n=1 Tax=Quadrisphaera sp. DSM 44207 TaxID=1881057 RepID=UPI00088A4A64|nr:glutaredoxin family protein [Quadrisphaera sp. DSM 44207]SDQ16165.1 Glutaredoxin [Quadrisphaera sp. DSM 44207]
MSAPSETAPRVVLYGRAGCHLCDVARETVRRVCAQTGAGWSEVDVDTDPELRARYTDLVPVVVVDGHHHDHWRIEEQRLRAALGG